MTARVIVSTPSYIAFHSGMRSRMYSCVRSASSWKVVLVVRPHPGHAVTLGENDRMPSACNSSHAA
jgi:hypothetical protein